MLVGLLKSLKIMNLENFLGMDKYAGYLWSCVVLTAVVLIGNVWLARRSLSHARSNARRRSQSQRSES